MSFAAQHRPAVDARRVIGIARPAGVTVGTLVLAGCCRSLQMTALNSLAFTDRAGAGHGRRQHARQPGAAGPDGGRRRGRRAAVEQGPADFQFALFGAALLAALAVLPYGRLSREADVVVSGHRVGASRP